MRAIIQEHKDASNIELEHLKRRGYSFFSTQNKMIMGYLRSITITTATYAIGGFIGMSVYLLCAFIGKALLETINYAEHYGLVREPGRPVYPRHSWNSNKIMSSLYLYNVTRHSSHHETANLNYWELETYPEAPMMSLGYLSIIYLIIFCPYYYHKMMVGKLIEWDTHFASTEERKIAMLQNKASGISLLKNIN